ncbi:MAG: uracil-DNA glycosylase [Pirellulales bacterium]|nr:uracil-DNA glycosylase [Pirellulales bacterium]
MAAGSADRILLHRLESLQRAGVTHLIRRSPIDVCAVDEVSAGVEQETAPSNTDTKKTDHVPMIAGSTHSDQQGRLDVLQTTVAACTRCEELARTRTQTVFGAGNPNARLVFLGEAPGADEDRQGIPFVGRAGQLLTRIIEACTLSREDVYILNILKCRPPGNRNPLPEEAGHCREYLNAQLAIIEPEFIVCLGAVAAHNLLEMDAPIGRMRGKFYLYEGIRVLCTYHPAYLLRNPAAKPPVWEDMQLLMSEMGIELPGK